MATRSETARRKVALADEIRAAVRAGQLRPGDALPPLHQLAERHRLAQSTVLTVLQPLIEEGLLTTVRSVGVFVARRAAIRDARDLFVTPAGPRGRNIGPVWRGFERRVVDLGGRPLCIGVKELDRLDRLPGDVGGVFTWMIEPRDLQPQIPTRVPCVYYGDTVLDPGGLVQGTDTVGLDNWAAGREAAEYLAQIRHREIAFLGIHVAEHPGTEWSRDREAGWSEAMARINPAVRPSLAYHLSTEPPQSLPNRERGAVAAQAMLPDLSRISAVVGADDRVLLGLIDVLRGNQIPARAWPAMVGFDPVAETDDLQGSILTSMRVEWEELGATAADLLRDRSSGRLTGPGVHRIVHARVVPRLSCVPGWKGTDNLADLLTTSV